MLRGNDWLSEELTDVGKTVSYLAMAGTNIQGKLHRRKWHDALFAKGKDDTLLALAKCVKARVHASDARAAHTAADGKSVEGTPTAWDFLNMHTQRYTPRHRDTETQR